MMGCLFALSIMFRSLPYTAISTNLLQKLAVSRAMVRSLAVVRLLCKLLLLVATSVWKFVVAEWSDLRDIVASGGIIG
jgi:hypothetical protein